MTWSSTYLGLQKAIADELGDRTDLLLPLSDSGLSMSPIQNAIQSAIAKWEREPFYFNSEYTVPFFTTVASQQFYTVDDAPAIATTPAWDRIHILINTNRYTLNARTWQYLEDIDVNPQATTSQPVDYAYFAEQFRLYPTPDHAYEVIASRYTRFTNLSADADSNVWTNDAYDLIRSEAKLILAQEVLHDSGITAECMVAIYGNPQIPGSRGYLYPLKAETTRRQGNGRLIPTYF